MQNYLFVMLGGALGALLRYAVGQGLSGIRLLTLPVGTFVVNILGCLILGLLTGVVEQGLLHDSNATQRHLLLMLTTGFCGAFTTFSTFSAETVKVAESGRLWLSALYVGASLVLGILCFWWAKGCVK